MKLTTLLIVVMLVLILLFLCVHSRKLKCISDKIDNVMDRQGKIAAYLSTNIADGANEIIKQYNTTHGAPPANTRPVG